ncbi:MAG: amidohydrolase [Planctomycetes bacterium]|nr:amidohydrolase [Planctomycetota bacterium]
MILNHCHVMRAGTKDDDPSWGTIDVLKEWMAELGIGRAVAFAPFYYQMEDDPNEWLHAAIKDEPGFIGYATINPKDENAPEKLREHVECGFRGAKFHPPIFRVQINDPEIDDFYSVAEELGIPIQFHTGVHGWFIRKYEPILLDDVAQKHPKLPLIIGHVGGTAFFDQALAVLQNNRNCYAELAQTRRESVAWHLSQERINTLLRAVGPDRIIYGADYPYNDLQIIRDDIDWIRGWGLKDEDTENILGGNIARLLGCDG